MFDPDDPIPTFTWRQLEDLLLSLAETPAKQLMVRHLVEGTRKQAPFLTPSGVMTEILFVSAALMDVAFRPPDWSLGT